MSIVEKNEIDRLKNLLMDRNKQIVSLFKRIATIETENTKLRNHCNDLEYKLMSTGSHTKKICGGHNIELKSRGGW